MVTYGVTDIQNKPSLMKAMDVAEIIDRRAHTTVGYFISSKYESFILPVIEKIDREEKLAKLHKLKNHQDLEFAELGVDDEYNRGDIVIVNLYPKKGDEVGKIRPAVIISGDDENAILDTLILMPLSTDLIDNMNPYRMRIAKRDGLKEDSDILINQIRTLSKTRIKEKIARLTSVEYDALIAHLCRNF